MSIFILTAISITGFTAYVVIAALVSRICTKQTHIFRYEGPHIMGIFWPFSVWGVLYMLVSGSWKLDKTHKH